MDIIYPLIFYFLCYSDHSVSTYLFSLSFEHPAVLDGHYISSHFLFPLLLGSQCVYLFISPYLDFLQFWLDTLYPYLFIFHFLYLLLFWMDTICPSIFYCLSHWNHSGSTYLFSLSLISCCSGWTLYIQSFSISSATRITVCLFIYFPFSIIPSVPGGHYMSSYFLLPMLLGSQWVYLIIFPFLYLLLFWMDTICPVIFISSATGITVCLLIYFPFPWLPAVLHGLYKTSHFPFPLLLGSQCVYLFFFPFLYLLLLWMETNIQSFSISAATRITVCLFIYFPFPWLPVVLDGLYITSHFLFPLLLGLQCLYLFIFTFIDFLLLWMDTIYPVIFNFLCYSDCSVSTYLFPFPWLPAVLAGHHISRHFLFPQLLGSQIVYLFIPLSLTFCWPRWTLYYQSFPIFSDNRITVCLLIYFPFPLLSAVLGGLYMSSHFLFPLLLGSQCVYLFIPPFL